MDILRMYISLSLSFRSRKSTRNNVREGTSIMFWHLYSKTSNGFGFFALAITRLAFQVMVGVRRSTMWALGRLSTSCHGVSSSLPLIILTIVSLPVVVLVPVTVYIELSPQPLDPLKLSVIPTSLHRCTADTMPATHRASWRAMVSTSSA
jgi:hypothetical protein